MGGVVQCIRALALPVLGFYLQYHHKKERKKKKGSRHWWLTPIILAIWESKNGLRSALGNSSESLSPN
jgi:hypothetical protein